MLIDEAKIKIRAGSGGSGMCHFYHDRHQPKGGPDGGNGGDGGDIYFETVSDITALEQFRYKKTFGAENGVGGGTNKRTGRDGHDLILKIPIGTTAFYDNGTSLEFETAGQTKLAARGGRGGRGNFMFRSSTNQQPKEFESGEAREWKKLRLELKLIADVGLIGLPNAGKSSLLNELTSAKAKVANYEFTTLEPNLGVTVGKKVIADIPGLIEGASDGKGLGIKFLKHVEKTRLLLHCISCQNPDLKKDYQIVRDEIEKYSSQLVKRKEYILLTKSDLIDSNEEIRRLVKLVGAKMAVSIIDETSIKKLSDFIHKQLN